MFVAQTPDYVTAVLDDLDDECVENCYGMTKQEMRRRFKYLPSMDEASIRIKTGLSREDDAPLDNAVFRWLDELKGDL